MRFDINYAAMISVTPQKTARDVRIAQGTAALQSAITLAFSRLTHHILSTEPPHPQMEPPQPQPGAPYPMGFGGSVWGCGGSIAVIIWTLLMLHAVQYVLKSLLRLGLKQKILFSHFGENFRDNLLCISRKKFKRKYTKVTKTSTSIFAKIFSF
jgi:hypothetical protein